jgi:hypothetical protein
VLHKNAIFAQDRSTAGKALSAWEGGNPASCFFGIWLILNKLPEILTGTESVSKLEGNAVLTHFAKDGEQVGNAEQFADLLAEVNEFKARAGTFGGDVEPDKCAKTHAVDVLQLSEVEDDSLALWQQLPDAMVENVANAEDQASAAAHKDG